MKTGNFVLFTILLTAMSLISRAQEDDFEHLLKDKKIRFSVFGSPLFEFSSVHGDFGFSTGGGGGILFNQTLFIGGYGLSLAPVIGKDMELNGVNYENLEINFGHGGIWAGYINNYSKLVHVGGSARFGWGKISFEDNPLSNPYEDHVLVITPQFEVEVNITRWFKANAGVGYRFVTSVNENVFRAKDFNSPEATVGLIFGWFRQRK